MADAKKKPKKNSTPPVLTPDELRASAQKHIAGAALALDFRDQAYYYQKAAELLSAIPDDEASAALAAQYRQQAETLLHDGYQTAYQSAAALMEQADTAEDFYQAAAAFRKIGEYQDAESLADACEKRYAKRSHHRYTKLIVTLLVFVLLAAAVIGMQTPFGKYQLGQIYHATGHYSAALSVFQHLEDYQDSDVLAQESRYQLAQQHLEKQQYEKAIHHFQKLGDYKDSQSQCAFAEQKWLTDAKPGDTVPFGSTKWIVLNTKEGCVLLLQQKPTEDVLGFNQTSAATDWKDCSLRKWLNTNYKVATFSAPEQALLTDAESDHTTGSVFLLNTSEAQYYQSLLKTTDYNWWLRTSGNTLETAAFVSPSNQVMDFGYLIQNTDIRVRPAIWVDCTIK